MTITGDGAQTRSVCYVTDLGAGLIRLMNSEPDPGPSNLGNPHEITIRELTEAVIRLTGSTSRLELCPLPTDDPVRRRPDISLAERALGWQPSISIESGLRSTIEYFAKLNGSEGP